MQIGQEQQVTAAVRPKDWSWPLWPALPLYPYGRRRTIRREVVPDAVWTFDQVQGLLNVVVPIRMVVVRLEEGGLLAYAPVAPTRECLRLVREIEQRHGPVRHIVLPTVSGVEHKVFAGPFARAFPAALLHIAPHQWSWPVNLPLSWLGLPAGRTRALDPRLFTALGCEVAQLGPIDLGLGPFVEVALHHRASRTLLVTDTLVAVPAEPPEIVQLDPQPLLFHAKDRAADAPADTPTNRRKGWQRVCLFAFYFRPGAVCTPGLGRLLADAWQAPDHSSRAYFGLFPFQWQPDWQESFERLRADGRAQVAPVLKTLILNRAPSEVRTWVERLADWRFQRIVPCHFDAPLLAGPDDLRSAFAFLDRPEVASLDADFALLHHIDRLLTASGLVPPAAERQG